MDDSSSGLLNDEFVMKLLRTHPNSFAVDTDGQDLDALIPALESWTELIVRPPSESHKDELPSKISSLLSRINDANASFPRSPIRFDESELIKLDNRKSQCVGMTPKKAHEVSRMTTYILRLLNANNLDLPADGPDSRNIRIVDVGAGQGYLTRILKAHLPHAHILALDADGDQTTGAQKWEERVLSNSSNMNHNNNNLTNVNFTEPPITHKTILISKEGLISAIDQWVHESLLNPEGNQVNADPVPAPVLFVALHACGSLTPDILRAFLAATKTNDHKSSLWYPAGLIAVGCCYNLMTPSDYPPSTKYLPMSAYHLAAQIPDQWFTKSASPSDSGSLTLTPLPNAALAIRKVTWRALLERVLLSAQPALTSTDVVEGKTPLGTAKSATVPARWRRRPEAWSISDAPDSSAIADDNINNFSSDLYGKTEKQGEPETGTGHSPTLARLGKLPSSAYKDWNTFLKAAEAKMGVCFTEEHFDLECSDQKQEIEKEKKHAARAAERQTLERKLAVLHVLRCLLGPVIEASILRDRIEYIRREFDADSTDLKEQGQSNCGIRQNEHKADLVNLFDQATGSGRNVAIVVAPRIPDFSIISGGS